MLVFSCFAASEHSKAVEKTEESSQQFSKSNTIRRLEAEKARTIDKNALSASVSNTEGLLTLSSAAREMTDTENVSIHFEILLTMIKDLISTHSLLARCRR